MLDQLTPNPGSRRPRKRVGRGIGSGHGKTCGRGQKGAGARSGSKSRPWFEGGQLPLVRRVPKRGFTNIWRVPSQVLNLRDLANFDGTKVTAESLVAAGLVRRADRPIKLLGTGEAKGKLQVTLQSVSAAARQKIEAAGGSVELVPVRRSHRAPEETR
jgi:large subunit ribosomal protein L15